MKLRNKQLKKLYKTQTEIMSIISDDNFGKNHKRVDINAHKNPVIKAESIECDKNFENSIRPKSFDTYIGQSALKETLKITIAAAKKREQPLDHLLLRPARAWKNHPCRRNCRTNGCSD